MGPLDLGQFPMGSVGIYGTYEISILQRALITYVNFMIVNNYNLLIQ